MYKEVISPILDHLPSEETHLLVRDFLHQMESSPQGLKLLEFLFAYRRKRFTSERLNVKVAGIDFDNPVMVAAGWDKNGLAVRALHQLGASGVEVGSVLREPQEGNPKPRQFVYKGGGVVLNRLGFNSPGALKVKQNLQRYKEDQIPIGISIGKNRNVEPFQAPEAHGAVARLLFEEASYFVINVSSPNTPGLRELQDKEPLTEIVQRVKRDIALNWEGEKPILVKIAPDLTLSAIDDVIQVIIDNNIDGVTDGNTTLHQLLKTKYGWGEEAGGLSGDDPTFRMMSTGQIAYIRKNAPNLFIMGVGGVKDSDSAWEKLAAGANLVQLNSALRSEGLSVFGKINSGLLKRMDQEGVKNITDIVGQEANKYLA